MAVKRGFVWVLLMLSIVLAVGTWAVYPGSEDSRESKAHAVRGLSLMGAGRDALADTHGLPAAAKTAASGAVRRNALPPLSLPPRRAVEVARQSESPQDALVAAQAIRRCKYLAGAAKMALDKIHERGIRAAPQVLAATMSPIESAERMCQELDGSMIAEYEPMLRRAMQGGLSGAAAMWWVTPEAKALGSAASETEALDLLKRDATQCELLSFGTYKVAAFQFPNKFEANEVAAVYAAAAQLYKDKKLRSNGLDKLMETFTPWYAIRLRIGVDENVVKDLTGKILSSCE